MEDEEKGKSYFEWFKLYLYHLWISIYENNKDHDYYLKIDLGNSKQNLSLFYPGSVPPNLRVSKNNFKDKEYKTLPPAYNRLNVLNRKKIKYDVGEKPTNNETKTDVFLMYSRHERDKRSDGVAFLERFIRREKFFSFIY